MVSASTIVLEYVCPALGTIAANFMFCAPFKDVQTAIARGALGDLNPLPWAFMLGNTCGWVTYAILTNNLFIFFANAPGFLLAAWFNLAASKLQFQQQFARISMEEESTTSDDSPTKDKHEDSVEAESTTLPQYVAPTHDYWVVGMTAFWMAVLATIGFGQNLSKDTKQLIVGTVVNLNLVFFYGAPLSTILTVIRTRNTASIHLWTMLTNTANGIFWTAYGFAVLDYFIYVPNGLGALLGGIQMVLWMIFPRVGANVVEDVDQANENNPQAKTDEETGKACASTKTALMTEHPSESLPLSVPFPSISVVPGEER